MPNEAVRLTMHFLCLKLPHLQLSVLCKGVPPSLPDLGEDAEASDEGVVGKLVCLIDRLCNQN